MSADSPRTTVSVTKATKTRLDKWRAPSQCYDAFLVQLVSLWEKTHTDNYINKTEAVDTKLSPRSKRIS
jgi:hypothetical protein